MPDYNAMTKEELIKYIQHYTILYRNIEAYYNELEGDAKQWADDNWKSIQYALVEKMADMVENRTNSEDS